MDECLHGDEQVIYGDKAYVDSQRQQDAQAEGVEWRVLRKATRGRKLTSLDSLWRTDNEALCVFIGIGFWHRHLLRSAGAARARADGAAGAARGDGRARTARAKGR